MVIQNFKDHVKILFKDEELIYGRNITLLNLHSNKAYQLEVDSSNMVEIKLDDGLHKLTIYRDSLDNIENCFSVFYNYLPEFINQVKNILCKCKDCNKNTNCFNTENYFTIINYLTFTGLIDTLKTVKYFQKLYHINYSEGTIYKSYYGEFKFNYNNLIKNIVAHAYVELYDLVSNYITNTEEDLIKLNTVYKIDLIERCLYSEGFDICNIKKLIEELKCKCNE